MPEALSQDSRLQGWKGGGRMGEAIQLEKQLSKLNING